MASQAVFDADLERLSATIERADAVVTEADGFRWVDETRVPAAVMSAYVGLVQYGYANGLLR